MHDFRSDTVTLPTPAMMAAIAGARLGDAARGDDPTVAELERRACEMTGKDDALFVPSGAMANLSAVIAHDGRGGEVIVEETAHIYNSEGGGLSVVAGAVPRPIRGDRGILSPDIVAAAIRGASDLAVAPTRLVCLENSHNAAGGTVTPIATMMAMVGGQVDLHFASLPAALPLIEGGKLRALATTSAQRLPSLPNVPTLIEAGYPGFDYYVFYGVLAPAGTPGAIIARLNAEIDRALEAPDMRKAFAERGVDVRAGTPGQFDAFLASERAKWERAVKDSGATVD